MLRPKAILFDLWGTLIDAVAFDPDLGNATLLAGAENPRGATLEEIRDFGRRLVASTISREEQAALEFTQGALFRILSDAFGLKFRLPPNELEWEFWNASLTVTRRPGVVEMLDEVRRRGIKSCVISNSSFSARTIERELERQGILTYFEFIISSADYGIRKPDELIFEAALRRLGVSREMGWFAGDNVGYDIIGAMKAGLFPIAYNAHASVPESVAGCKAISNWRELTDFLDQVSGETKEEVGDAHWQA